MQTKIYILNEASNLGCCLLLLATVLFPETVTGSWFLVTVIALMCLILLSGAYLQKKKYRPILYQWQDRLCLTTFLWFYYYFEKASVLFFVLYVLFDAWGGNPIVAAIVPLVCGIFLGLKAAMYSIAYALHKKLQS